MLALSVGLVVLALRPHRPWLAEPAACPGVVDLVAVFGSRWLPDVPLASMLAWMNALLVLAAVASFTRLVQVTTGRGAVAAAMGLAVGAAPMFARTMAPSSAAAAFAVCACTFLALRGVDRTGPRDAPETRGRVLPSLAALGLITPRLIIPAAVVAGWWIWIARATLAPRRRVTAAVLASAVVALGGVAVSEALALLPPGGAAGPPSALRCAWPDPAAFSRSAALEVMRAAAATIGSLPFGLAALGAFSNAPRLKAAGGWPAVALALAPIVTVAASGSAALTALAPTFVAFWWLVGAGLDEVIKDLRGGVARLAAATVLVLLLPLLQTQRRSSFDAGTPIEARGHDRLSHRGSWRMVRALPDRAVLVEEDAVIDLLLRSVAVELRRAGKTLRVVPRRTQAVADELERGQVFALPRAQLELQHRGFRFTVEAAPPVPGIARVLSGGACRQLGPDWGEIPDLSKTSRLAVVADRPDAYGPVLLFLGSVSRLDQTTLGWPPETTERLLARQYDLGRDEDRRSLAYAVGAHAAPPDSAVFRAPHVTELELRRTPGAPLVLPLALNRAPTGAIARTVSHAPDVRLEICPSFAYEVPTLAAPR